MQVGGSWMRFRTDRTSTSTRRHLRHGRLDPSQTLAMIVVADDFYQLVRDWYPDSSSPAYLDARTRTHNSPCSMLPPEAGFQLASPRIAPVS